MHMLISTVRKIGLRFRGSLKASVFVGASAHLLDTLSTVCPALADDALAQMRAVFQTVHAYPKAGTLVNPTTLQLLKQRIKVWRGVIKKGGRGWGQIFMACCLFCCYWPRLIRSFWVAGKFSVKNMVWQL